MANIPGVVALFRAACKYVGVIHLKSGYCSPLCVQNVTLKGWKAMKGESMATRRSIDYSCNAAQLYALIKGWHIGGRQRETISDPAIRFAEGMYATEKGRFMRTPHASSDREYLAVDSLSQLERDGSEENEECPNRI
ncbi:MAG: hypothetical protein NTW84_00730 [Methanothrix sp.]|nr:hypothetical protein [Methanothrix sp.]